MSSSSRLSLPLWNERFAAPPAPTSGAEMRARGWDDVDVVFVTGDAYVDHPSFAGRPADARAGGGRLSRRRAAASRTGTRASRGGSSAGRGCSSPSAPATWTRSSTTTPPTRRSATTTPTRRAAASACVPTAPRCRTAIGPARPFPACRSSPAASRRRCAGWPITTTGATPSAARSCSTARPTSSSTAWAKQTIVEIARRLAAGKTVRDLRDLRGVAYVLGRERTRRAGGVSPLIPCDHRHAKGLRPARQ